MAYGVTVVIPASNHTEVNLSGTGGGSSYPSIKVLNPNDGVVYIARNRDSKSTNQGEWDWKVPSQSYASLPGPFTSVGMFYLDQSGAGRQGEFTVYASQQKLDEPDFHAIGRALQALQTSLDITEGVAPANPGAGILRLWADGTDALHGLSGAGVDRTLISTLTALGGGLSGFMPNPALAAPYASYAPVMSQSVGITLSGVFARYSQIDKIVHVLFAANMSSAGVAGVALNVSLPITADASLVPYMGLGQFVYVRSGVNFNAGVVSLVSQSFTQFWLGGIDSNVFGINPSFAVANGDSFEFSLLYKAA